MRKALCGSLQTNSKQQFSHQSQHLGTFEQIFAFRASQLHRG